MNLILLNRGDFIADDIVRLAGRRHDHIVSVLRARPGDTLKVGLLNGPVGSGQIQQVDQSVVFLKIQLNQTPPEPLPVTLILALPRPKVLKRLLQGLCAMGIKDIVLYSSWRVDKSYWQSPLLQPDALAAQACLGLEQGRDTRMPTIRQFRRFRPFVEDHFPEIVAGKSAWVAHPGLGLTCPANVPGSNALVIGPEGGFTQYELDPFIRAGCAPVKLGERPLRVEQAVPALLGRLIAFP